MRTPARALALALTALCAGALYGCGGPARAGDHESSAAAALSGAHPASSPSAVPSAPELPRQLPGLGPRTLAQVPSSAGQVVEAVGTGKDSSTSRVTVYRRTDEGWTAGPTWAAHNAARGWSDDHRAGDLRSPIGVFTLTDAGGLLADPGTKLPYDHSWGFANTGASVDGESLAGAFDYVVAINYNRRTGVSPLDWTRPEGDARGGGIWFHVDHGGPTHGCVSISKAHMKDLLRTLDPARHPVVVMGDAASLRR